jgi:hypothetical protein
MRSHTPSGALPWLDGGWKDPAHLHGGAFGDYQLWVTRDELIPEYYRCEGGAVWCAWMRAQCAVVPAEPGTGHLCCSPHRRTSRHTHVHTGHPTSLPGLRACRPRRQARQLQATRQQQPAAAEQQLSSACRGHPGVRCVCRQGTSLGETS